jgi:glycerol-3-phosphate dehydrogenase
MDRIRSLAVLNKIEEWDLIVIGGGATGLGTAVDAASRGYKTLLLEQADFAKGTSSRSTKLVHGGVRYLEQGDIKLVREALRERGYLLRNAPHLARRQAFIIPVYSFWERIKYTVGLKLYDILAGRLSIGNSVFISRSKVIEYLPGIKKEGKALKGGVLYYDGQFDDARMAVSLAATCEDKGGVVINYMVVTNLLKDDTGRLTGVTATDKESGSTYQLYAKAVVNATGVFVDEVHQLDTGRPEHTVQPSQGIHLVLPPSFLQTVRYALMIPATDDGRVLFMVPWHDHLLAGTTDTPLEEHSLEPRALETEIDFILRNAGKYLKNIPGREDVLSVFAGLRPLALPPRKKSLSQGKQKATKDISRSHSLQISDSGLITITGGKWTTYRKMAEDTVNTAIKVAGLPIKACMTAGMKIHGWSNEQYADSIWNVYGSDRMKIEALIHENPVWERRLDDSWPYMEAEVVWAVREEMARTVEDVLSRRLRVLFLDAKAAIRMASRVAEIMKEELHKDELWQQQQAHDFIQLARQYLLAASPQKFTLPLRGINESNNNI